MWSGQYNSLLLSLVLASDNSTPMAHIMSEWLDMNAICRLDNAIVSGRVGGLREDFLASLKHWSIFNGLGAGTDSDAFVDWLLLRGITVRVLHPALEERVKRCRIQRHDVVARAALYKRIVTVHPCYRHVPALCDYGNLLIDTGEIAEAEAMYQRVLAIDPDDFTTLNNYGALLSDRGDLVAAEAMYQRGLIGLVIHPDNVTILGNYGVLLMKRGDLASAEAMYQRGVLAEAEAMFQRVLAIHPGHVTTLGNYGVLLDDRGENAAAEAMYQRALAIDPDDVITLNNYGFLLYKRGDFAAAEAMYQRGLVIDPDDVITLGDYGNLLHKRGDLAEAEAMYQRVYDIRSC